MAATTLIIPRSPKLALVIPEWKSAIEKEFKVLRENNTWILILRAPDVNFIDTKWAFRVKYNEDALSNDSKPDSSRMGCDKFKGQIDMKIRSVRSSIHLQFD